jgi:hypothetical protein
MSFSYECSRIEVSATGRTFVQSSPTECGVSVIPKLQQWGGLGPLGLSSHERQRDWFGVSKIASSKCIVKNICFCKNVSVGIWWITADEKDSALWSYLVTKLLQYEVTIYAWRTATHFKADITMKIITKQFTLMAERGSTNVLNNH